MNWILNTFLNVCLQIHIDCSNSIYRYQDSQLNWNVTRFWIQRCRIQLNVVRQNILSKLSMRPSSKTSAWQNLRSVKSRHGCSRGVLRRQRTGCSQTELIDRVTRRIMNIIFIKCLNDGPLRIYQCFFTFKEFSVGCKNIPRIFQPSTVSFRFLYAVQIKTSWLLI